MRILLHSATKGEIQPIFDEVFLTDSMYTDGLYVWQGHHVDIIVSGVGIPHTVFSLTKRLAEQAYDLCISVGICGSFNKNIPVGTVLEVTEDRFGDIGYEDKYGKFFDVFESNLTQQEFPYSLGGWLKPTKTFTTSLTKAIGVTVNKVSGTEESANLLHQKYRADIETMEGAAFFLVCMLNNIPCIQIKSVSNYVEARDKSKWNIPLAVKNLNSTTRDIIKGIPVQG